MSAMDTVKEVWDKVAKGAGTAVDKTKEVASTAVDKTKEVASTAVDKTKEVASKVDDKLEQHAAKDGIIGSAAGLGHKVVDKVDGD